jgi:hypothetical protein
VACAIALTEKYYPRGLLGYGFFGRGLTVEVRIGREPAKALVILAGSEGAARRIFDEYGKYLKEAKAVPQISHDKKGTAFHVIDPLYKGTALYQSGPFVVGVVGLKEPHEGDGFVGQLLERLPATLSDSSPQQPGFLSSFGTTLQQPQSQSPPVAHGSQQ